MSFNTNFPHIVCKQKANNPHFFSLPEFIKFLSCVALVIAKYYEKNTIFLCKISGEPNFVCKHLNVSSPVKKVFSTNEIVLSRAQHEHEVNHTEYAGVALTLRQRPATGNLP
jgi:hypothetical protein